MPHLPNRHQSGEWMTSSSSSSSLSLSAAQSSSSSLWATVSERCRFLAPIYTDDLSQKEIFAHTFGTLYGDKQICTNTRWRETLTTRFIFVELLFDVALVVVALVTAPLSQNYWAPMMLLLLFVVLAVACVPYNNRIPFVRMLFTVVLFAVVIYHCQAQDADISVTYYVVLLSPLLLLLLGLSEKLFCSQLVDNYLETEVVALEREFPFAVSSGGSVIGRSQPQRHRHHPVQMIETFENFTPSPTSSLSKGGDKGQSQQPLLSAGTKMAIQDYDDE
jgi:hypothetical protein